MNPGTYPATATSALVWEAESKAIMIEFAWAFESGETTKDSVCLIQKDGTISEITVRNLRQCFSWDGVDPFWLEDPDNIQGKPVELVIEQEEYKEKMRTRVKYINPPGGGGNHNPVDRTAFANRFGAKLRAMAGGTAPKPAPKAPAKAPAQQSLPTMPLEPLSTPKCDGPPVTGTMEGAWQALCDANPGADPKGLEVVWRGAIARMRKPQQDLNDEEWGELTMSFAAKL